MNSKMMAARNTRGFSASVQSGRLPESTHLTYEGVFNEINFDVGNKTDKIVDLHYGYARYQFAKSAFDSEINDYLAVFFKSSKDGADRDDTPINALICLDISGSMNGGLGQNRKTELSRLKLSVQAIKMFISKLRPNDSIGLITFNTQGQVIFQPVFKKQLDNDIFSLLDKIVTCGGTTVRSGFDLSKTLLQSFVKKNQLFTCQNRIIMLTDVGDNSFNQSQNFIESASVEDGINLTVIGISTEFRSQTCQKLKNIRGFNYFCAVNEEDIKKYVFETFDFGFFPSAYDINLSISSEDVRQIEAFGSPDSDQVGAYNDHFKGQSTLYTISKMKSVFPSQLQIKNDTVFTIGGLILVKLKRKSHEPFFKGQLKVSYNTPKGTFFEQSYHLGYEFHPTQQFFSQECLKDAIEGYMFTSQMKSLIQASKKLDKPQIYKQFWPLLKQLKSIVPESKNKDYQNIKKIVQGYAQ